MTNLQPGRFARLHGFVRVLLGVLLLGGYSAHAQWQTQHFILKPGWNAIYLHVDASHLSLDELIPNADSPVAEIWYWRPNVSTSQFIDNPAAPVKTDSRWLVWTAARRDTDTLQRLVGNGAYLVRNKGTQNWPFFSVTGRPVPPAYQWTTTGLNLIGFPTPPREPFEPFSLPDGPSFTTFLSPAPGLDLARTLQNAAKVFRYPGGEAPDQVAPIPEEVVAFRAGSVPVVRGQAFWVRGSTNYYNHYYGPVEVSLQNSAGIRFGDTLGTYSLRLKNRTAANRTVALNLLASESAPPGQPAIVGTPQLLVRGVLNPGTLTYTHTVLNNASFTLTPEGEVGSEVEVVLGLNRSLMTAQSGSQYAGILRVTDTDGLQQVDLPVSGTVPDAAGLWVGQATVDRVGQYLRIYSKATNEAALATVLANANLPGDGAQVPGSNWVAVAGTDTLTNGTFGRYYKAAAASLDGRRAVAVTDYTTAPHVGRIFVTSDYGATWQERNGSLNLPYKSVACSGDGLVMVAGVFGGQLYVSTDGGITWVARGPTPGSILNWIGVAASADGSRMTAVVQGGGLYSSTDRGETWQINTAAGARNWSGVASSQDGSRLVATVNPGSIHTSADGGASWRINTSPGNTAWYAVASSADGQRLIACSTGAGSGLLYVSTDAGTSWRTTTHPPRHWHGVATSTDGLRLAAASHGAPAGQNLQLSNDGGQTWTSQSPAPDFLAVAMSGDARRIYAPGYLNQIHALQRSFRDYELDPATGLIRDETGRYLSTGVNTAMAKVPSPLPLRLILHHDAAGQVRLLQRVFVGKGANTTNTIVASREQLLDAAQITSARRISTPHLPFSAANTFWSSAGNFNAASVVTLTVPVDYNDHASNPFLHTFHPDHDNLDPKFKQVRPPGEESYDITREIKLTFQSPGTDFRSLTASAQGRSGAYEETITLGGKAGATRQFQLSGTFSLQRISPIPTLTTQ